MQPKTTSLFFRLFAHFRISAASLMFCIFAFGGNLQLVAGQEQQLQLSAADQMTLREQTRDILFYRQMEIYNYKTNETRQFLWYVPFEKYFEYRTNASLHSIPYVDNSDIAVDAIEKSLSTWHDMKKLAEMIRYYSGDDDELYANMVLQVTHQLFYNATSYTKTPIETFVEGSGDCDSFSIFAAALLKAGGLDSIAVVGYAKKGLQENGDYSIVEAHAIVGVNLPERPDDHELVDGGYGHIDYQGERYYLAETTIVGPFHWSEYDSTLAISVGDIPWDDYDIKAVIAPS